MAKEINISDKKGIEEEKKSSIKKQEKKKKEKKKLPRERKILILTLIGATILLGGIATFFYFGIFKLKKYKSPNQIVNISQGYIISAPISSLTLNIPTLIPSEPKTEESPINGLLFTKTEMDLLKRRRPIAVMINNHSEARPQSGLNSADIVYEALVESGITRYLAIFWSEAPSKVGPIRSARQYYLEWLSPYDALYIYDGCAKTDNPKTNACGNIYSYNIKSIATLGAWRWNDGRRYAPHNEYSSLEKAWEHAKAKKWDSAPSIDTYKFKKENSSDNRGERTKVKVTFYERLNNGGQYDAIWTYDPRTNRYLRTIGGRVDIDQETDTQVYAKNVILQQVTLSPSYDNKARVILETIGEGKATYLIDGKVISGKWKKSTRTSRTKYYNNEGEEIQFNRGRIWVSTYPHSAGKFDIIEQ